LPRSELPPAFGARLPRVAAALGAAALTAFFVVRGFPYDLLARRIEASVARRSGLELHLGQLGPRFSLLGPGVQAREARLAAPGGAGLRVERLWIRPAWSPGWLLLRPAFRIGALVAGGSLDGTLAAGPAFAGELGALDLEQLPIAALWPGAALAGRLDATLELRGTADGPAGSIALAARAGSATLPGLPLPLAFETLSVRLALGQDALVRVEQLELSGPGVEARVAGSLGRAASFAAAPLDLRIELAVDPGLRAGLQGFGVPLRPDGRASLHVTGTAARPVVVE
jgi:type II secretion system protein N